MYHLKFALLVLALFTGMATQAAESLLLTIRQADGSVTQIEIPFPDETAGEALPTMKFTETAVEITVPSKTEGGEAKIHTIGVEALENSTFDMTTTSLESTVMENSTVFSIPTANMVRIDAAGEVSPKDVKVYDIAGQQMAVQVEARDNSAIVSLEGLAAGVYVISYKTNTIKISKR